MKQEKGTGEKYGQGSGEMQQKKWVMSGAGTENKKGVKKEKWTEEVKDKQTKEEVKKEQEREEVENTEQEMEQNIVVK